VRRQALQRAVSGALLDVPARHDERFVSKLEAAIAGAVAVVFRSGAVAG
jgi:hypothetical protein